MQVTGLIRRCVASLMVLAVAAFVLHGTVHAGHLHGITPNELAAQTNHVHVQGHGSAHISHDHGDHANAQHGGAGQGHGKSNGNADEPCCGNLCTVGIPVLTGLAAGIEYGRMPLAAPYASSATGIDPDSLKRPPRPLALV